MNSITFALPSGYNWDIKKFAKAVKTKSFVTKHKKHLCLCADRLTSANKDPRQVIGGMLQVAYGANIGRQVEDLLTDTDLKQIKSNIIRIVYK